MDKNGMVGEAGEPFANPSNDLPESAGSNASLTRNKYSGDAPPPSTPSPAPGWRDIESAPKDGTRIMVWADGFEWPEVVFYEFYDPADAEEFGENGYWRYADDLLTEVTDDCGAEDWTHWMPLPPPPTTEAER